MLEQYENHRKPRNMKMAAAVHLIKAAFATQWPLAFPLARGLTLAVLNNATPVKKFIVKSASGLDDNAPYQL